MKHDDITLVCAHDEDLKLLAGCFYSSDSFPSPYLNDLIIWLYPRFYSLTREQRIALDNWVYQHRSPTPTLATTPEWWPKTVPKLFAVMDRISLRNNVTQTHSGYASSAVDIVVGPWFNADIDQCMSALSKAVRESKSKVVQKLLAELLAHYQGAIQIGKELSEMTSCDTKKSVAKKRQCLPQKNQENQR